MKAILKHLGLAGLTAYQRFTVLYFAFSFIPLAFIDGASLLQIVAIVGNFALASLLISTEQIPYDYDNEIEF